MNRSGILLVGVDDNTATQAPAATGGENECIGESHGGNGGHCEPAVWWIICGIGHEHKNWTSDDQSQQQYDSETVAAVYDATTSSRVLSLETLDAETQQKNEEDNTNYTNRDTTSRND